jgi:hypothetical protein
MTSRASWTGSSHRPQLLTFGYEFKQSLEDVTLLARV